MTSHTNLEIAQLLRNAGTAYTLQDASKFRFQIIAYQKAADAIETSTTELADLYKQHQLSTIPGVGPGIAGHIKELFETGHVKHFEEITKHIPSTVFMLMKVPSFGPKKAFKLVMEFNLTNEKTIFEDVEKIAKDGKIAPLEGFGEKSQSDILRALQEFKKGAGKTKRMMLPFANELAEQLIQYLKKSPDVISAFPLGSLRRRVATVGDIDIAVSTNKPEEAIEYFTKYPNQNRVIEKGAVSAAILTSGGKQVDLIALKPSQLGSLLQHFTGSKNHNVKLREHALRHNMSLSERGIKMTKNQDLRIKNYEKNEEIREYNTEEKFYNALGMAWIPPELREDTGEVECALKQAQGLQPGLPKLVELKDIKGDLHIHSNYPIQPSHDLGTDSMEDMVKRAIELNYEFIGFSEHNPSVSNHTASQTYNILQERNEYIEKLREKYKKIKILSLMETDILVDGELALEEKSLNLLDGTLVSIHSSFKMNKIEMTKRVLQGFSHPKAKILSHPTGRLLEERPGYELNWDEVFDFAKTHNKALEINSSPNRLDLPDIIVREAVKSLVPLVIDTDSHALWQMDLMEYGVSVARRGWAEKKNILNTLSAKEFVDWLRS